MRERSREHADDQGRPAVDALALTAERRDAELAGAIRRRIRLGVAAGEMTATDRARLEAEASAAEARVADVGAWRARPRPGAG